MIKALTFSHLLHFYMSSNWSQIHGCITICNSVTISKVWQSSAFNCSTVERPVSTTNPCPPHCCTCRTAACSRLHCGFRLSSNQPHNYSCCFFMQPAAHAALLCCTRALLLFSMWLMSLGTDTKIMVHLFSTNPKQTDFSKAQAFAIVSSLTQPAVKDINTVQSEIKTIKTIII